MKITSRYVRMRNHSTNEEQVFDNYTDAIEWGRNVVHTYQATTKFDVVEVTERTKEILLKYSLAPAGHERRI